jgi:hypothetical protein
MRNIKLEIFETFQAAVQYAKVLSMLGYGTLILPIDGKYEVSYLPKR